MRPLCVNSSACTACSGPRGRFRPLLEGAREELLLLPAPEELALPQRLDVVLQGYKGQRVGGVT